MQLRYIYTSLRVRQNQVQEDFGIGLGEIQRARAAERVTSGTKDMAQGAAKAVGAAATATVNSVQEIDSKLRISERTVQAMEAVRDSSVVQNTAAALTKAGSSVKTATVKVLDQPAVTSATEAVNSGIRKLGASLSSLTRQVVPRRADSNGNVRELDEDDESMAPTHEGYQSHQGKPSGLGDP